MPERIVPIQRLRISRPRHLFFRQFVSVFLAPALLLTSSPINISVLAQDTASTSNGTTGTPPEAMPPVVPDTKDPGLTPPESKFSLPDSPSTVDLTGSRLFPEPLAPTVSDPSVAENTALAAALKEYSRDHKSQVLVDYLSTHASSPWALSVSANLGLLKFQEGYFTAAMDYWTQAWNLGKNSNDTAVESVTNRAVAELIKMNCRVGRMAEASVLLQDVSTRSFHGLTANMIANAQQAILIMKNQPKNAFKCGPYALRTILIDLKKQTPEALATIGNYPTTAQGTSLKEVNALADQIGLKMQVAKRVSGKELPLPAIVNWKLNHYGALTKAQNGSYLLIDPTFGTSQWVLKDAVDQEASGYFLVRAGSLPKGWVAVNAEEAGKVWGRGYVTEGDSGATKGNDPSSGGSSSAGVTSCPVGLATWKFHTMLASLNISDIPLAYYPPVGPAIECYVTYDSKEQNQPSTPTYANLGPLWNFSWQSSIRVDSSNAFVAMGTGGTELYSNFSETTASYDVDPQSKCVLVRTSLLPTKYERRAPDGSKKIFGISDSSNRFYLTEIWDAQGNKIILSYDAKFRLIKIKDAIGQFSTISYVSNSVGNARYFHVSKFTDPFGRVASFTYDSSGRLTSITDMIGMKSQFSYGAADFITTLTTPYGSTTFTRTLSEDGNIDSLVATEPDGGKQRLDSVIDSNTLGITAYEGVQPQGMSLTNDYLNYRNSFFWDRKAMLVAPGDYKKAKLTHFLHDSTGVLKGSIPESEKSVLENRVWYYYQNQTRTLFMNTGMLANPTQVARVLDNGTTQLYQYEYNALGSVTKVTDPKGRITEYVYADNGIDLLSVAQKEGSTNYFLQKYTWNSQHRPLTSTDAGGRKTTMTYNSRGQVLTSTNPLGQVTTYVYDANGYLTSEDGPLADTSDKTTLAYDTYGRINNVTTGEGYALTIAYDALNRPTTVTFPDGTFTQATYTNLDQTQFKDRLGRVTKFTYNSVRQMTSVTDPLNRLTKYTWCNCGSLKKIIDPSGRTTSWEQDVAGRPVSKTYADGTTETYEYEQTTSRMKSVRDAMGQARICTYNSDNTLAEISFANALVTTPGVKLVYDAVFPRLNSMTDGIGKTTYTYKPIISGPNSGAGMLETQSGPWPNSVISFKYDALGRVTTRTVNNVASTISYDAIGRIPSLTNALGTFAYTYQNASSRMTRVNYPNGQQMRIEYEDQTGDFRLSKIQNVKTDGTTFFSQFKYTSNAAGNLLTWTQRAEGTDSVSSTLSYDAADQLTGSAATDNNFSYAYDLAGNRTSQNAKGANTTAAYNLTNQVQQISPTLPNDKTYQWDVQNRLVKIMYTGTALSTFLSYDGMDRCARIVEKDGNTVISDKRFVWSGLERVEERNASNAVTRRFFSQGEQVGSTKYFYTRDHLGSVREMTDAAGVVQARYSYDPYGNQTKVMGTLSASLGYTGHYSHEPSGLTLAPFRSYDQKIGRWLSRDPLKESVGLNLYAYVGNNPLNFTDPTGLIQKEAAATGTVSVGLGVTSVVIGGLAIITAPVTAPAAAILGGIGLIGLGAYSVGTGSMNTYNAWNDYAQVGTSDLFGDVADRAAPGNKCAAIAATAVSAASGGVVKTGALVGLKAAKYIGVAGGLSAANSVRATAVSGPPAPAESAPPFLAPSYDPSGRNRSF